jgi:hypothetical protein
MASQGQGNQQAKTRASMSDHVAEQTGHAVDTAGYGGHGHMFTKHPATGAQMPPNDAPKQPDHHMPQGGLGSGDPSGDCDEGGM